MVQVTRFVSVLATVSIALAAVPHDFRAGAIARRQDATIPSFSLVAPPASAPPPFLAGTAAPPAPPADAAAPLDAKGRPDAKGKAKGVAPPPGAVGTGM